MEDELALFLQLISETDGAVDVPATRKPRPLLGWKHWKHFYEAAQKGNVTPTMLIDFQYKPNGTIERMYCFKDGYTDRVVLHAHTSEPWPGLPAVENEHPATRARKVTSVNARLGIKGLAPTKGGPMFSQEAIGVDLVGVHDWEKKKKAGKDIEWSWGTAGHMPPCEQKILQGLPDKGLNLQRAYDEV